MALPRFRLRHLMLAAAVAGVEYWALACDAPGLALVLLGPLVSACWACCPRPGPLGHIRAGVRGGLVGAVAFGLVLAGRYISERSPHSFRPETQWEVAALDILTQPALNVAIAFVIGLVVELASVPVLLVSLPFRPPPPCPACPPDPRSPSRAAQRS
jgi:hypothetical protein